MPPPRNGCAPSARTCRTWPLASTAPASRCWLPWSSCSRRLRGQARRACAVFGCCTECLNTRWGGGSCPRRASRCNTGSEVAQETYNSGTYRLPVQVLQWFAERRRQSGMPDKPSGGRHRRELMSVSRPELEIASDEEDGEEYGDSDDDES